MARRLKEEEDKLISRTEYERAVKELNDMYYKLIIRNKELIEENEKLRNENADLHNKE
jgi:hypothetical protein